MIVVCFWTFFKWDWTISLRTANKFDQVIYTFNCRIPNQNHCNLFRKCRHSIHQFLPKSSLSNWLASQFMILLYDFPMTVCGVSSHAWFNNKISSEIWCVFKKSWTSIFSWATKWLKSLLRYFNLVNLQWFFLSLLICIRYCSADIFLLRFYVWNRRWLLEILSQSIPSYATLKFT